MNLTKKKGFTLIELVIVIAVIGILAAVLIPTFTSVIGDARESSAMQSAKSAYTAFLMDTVEDETEYTYVIIEANGYYFLSKSGNMENVTDKINDDATEYTPDGGETAVTLDKLVAVDGDNAITFENTLAITSVTVYTAKSSD